MYNKSAITKIQALVIAIIVVVAVVAGVVYVFYAAPPKAPAVPEYILIGATVDVTGPNAFVERIFVYAWKWAVAKINEHGGVYVKEYNARIPIKLIYYDDASDVNRAIANMEALILKDNVLCMIGKMGPVGGELTIPLADKYGVPTFGLQYYPHEKVKASKYYWSQPFESYENMTSTLLRMINDLKLTTNKKVAILTMEEPTTPIEFEYFRRAAEKYGFEIVYMDSYTILTTDYTIPITRIKESGADILIWVGIGPDTTTFWRQCKTLGYRPKIAQLALGARTYGWVEAMGKDGEYVCTIDFWCPHLPYKVEKYGATSKDLAEDYERETGEKWDSALGHSADTIFIFAEAIEIAGTLDREKVNEAMASVEGEFLCGYLRFVERHLPVPDYVFQWQGGVKKLVWIPSGIPVTPEANIIFPLPPWD